MADMEGDCREAWTRCGGPRLAREEEGEVLLVALGLVLPLALLALVPWIWLGCLTMKTSSSEFGVGSGGTEGAVRVLRG